MVAFVLSSTRFSLQRAAPRRALCGPYLSRPSVRSTHRQQLRAGAPGAQADSTVDFDKVLETLAETRDEALAAAQAADNSKTLQDAKVAYLGKKGKLSGYMGLIGKLPKKDKPKLGSEVNKVRDTLEEVFADRKIKLAESDLEATLKSEAIDVTMPGITNTRYGHVHPITSTINRAVKVFTDLGYTLIDDPKLSPEIENEYYNFEALNCPENHPARDMQDTFYLDKEKGSLLRTHTSSVQIRYLENNEPPFAIICPGRVYRRDTVDATHSALFHQVEIMAITKDLNLGNLRATIIHFLKIMFGEDCDVRFRGSFFPFTEPSMEVDVFFRGKWLEVLGCGMVDPAVLEMAGVDPNEWQGFAAGFGVERFAMVTHQIPDIREFYRNDTRFLEQFPQPPGVL